MNSTGATSTSADGAGQAGSDGLRARLATARLYLCTDARQRQGDLPGFLDAVLAGGVDIVQLRQKGLEAGQELRYLDAFRLYPLMRRYRDRLPDLKA